MDYTADERISALEKDVTFILKIQIDCRAEIRYLKKSIKEAIQFIEIGNNKEAIELMNRECKEGWMTPEKEKAFLEDYEINKDKYAAQIEAIRPFMVNGYSQSTSDISEIKTSK